MGTLLATRQLASTSGLVCLHTRAWRPLVEIASIASTLATTAGHVRSRPLARRAPEAADAPRRDHARSSRHPSSQSREIVARSSRNRDHTLPKHWRPHRSRQCGIVVVSSPFRANAYDALPGRARRWRARRRGRRRARRARCRRRLRRERRRHGGARRARRRRRRRRRDAVRRRQAARAAAASAAAVGTSCAPGPPIRFSVGVVE